MKLSPIQEKIVETPGNLIVRASAGTGKTHTMVNKIAKEIDDNHTHKVTENIDNIVWLSPTKANWVTEVLSNIVPDKKSALLRFSNDNARIGASELTTNGLEYVYIPPPFWMLCLPQLLRFV